MDTILNIDLSGGMGPKYVALAGAIADAISGGRLKTGTRMPPVRDLAWKLKVTPGTVSRAYRRLTEQGVLAAQVGRGTFVAEPPQPLPQPREISTGVLDLRTPTLPDVGQVGLIRRALHEAAARPADVLMRYPDRKLSDGTRAAILASIDSFDTSGLDERNVVLCNGGQHAFSLILMAVLKGPTPVMMSEELGYQGFRHAARLVRAELKPLAQDEEGPLPSAIRACCEADDVQLLATSSHAHNPTTIATSPARRHEIAELAREYDFQIVDDQCYSLVNKNRPSYRDLAPERVWFISSVSKAISPALRLGWFITPDGKADVGQMVARHSFFALSQPMSDVAHLIKTAAEGDGLRAEVSARVAARVQILKDALDGFDLRARLDVPFAYLSLPKGWRASGFQRACEKEGILIRAADEYVLSDGRAPNAVRFGIDCRSSCAAFEAGCQRIRRLLDDPPHEIDI